MRCGFCGHDNPAGAKRCKHCKADLTSQQMYSRGSGSGFGGTVNRSSSGVTRQSTGSTGTVRQSTSGTGQSAGSQTTYRSGTTVNSMALRQASSVKAAKVFALAFVLVPAIFMIVVVAMILRTNREWQQEAETQTAVSNDLQEELLEHHGLSKYSYSLAKNSEYKYTMTLNGVEYTMLNYKNALTGDNGWRSDYFTGTFKRMTSTFIGTPVYQSSFGDAVTDLQYSVYGLFPLWLNFSEIDKIKSGTADMTKWLAARSEARSFEIIVSIIMDEDYPVTEEWFDEIKDALFFATEIDIECPGKCYRYYPYEELFEEE